VVTTIDLILPALDEALALPALLARVPAGVRAIVVDNGSTDDTARVAASLGATVVPEPIRGFGSACAAGLAASDADIVVFCDADGSIDPGDIWLVIDPVVRGDADLVIGARIPTARGAWPAHARLANRYLARRIRRRFDLDVSDMGPLRAMRRTMVIDLGIEDRRFGWPLEMIVRAGHAGWRIQEAPVPYRPRVGRSKVTGTIGGTARAIRDMGAILTQLDARAGGGPGQR
jgi:dTDP-L-rhamnose 4-epimerase